MIIQSQRVKKAILTALADEEITKILNIIMHHSKSIANITRQIIFLLAMNYVSYVLIVFFLITLATALMMIMAIYGLAY